MRNLKARAKFPDSDSLHRVTVTGNDQEVLRAFLKQAPIGLARKGLGSIFPNLDTAELRHSLMRLAGQDLIRFSRTLMMWKLTRKGRGILPYLDRKKQAAVPRDALEEMVETCLCLAGYSQCKALAREIVELARNDTAVRNGGNSAEATAAQMLSSFLATDAAGK